MKYTVEIKVIGKIIVDVDGNSFENAIENANHVIEETDFGPLHDIDWETYDIVDNETNETLYI